MMKIRTVCAVLGLASLAIVPQEAFADTSELLSGGSKKTDAYSNGSYWSGGVAPNNSDGSVNTSAASVDFVVKDGMTFRTCDRNKPATIGGASLQLGASDFSSAGNVEQTVQRYNISGKTVVTVPELRLYKGKWSYYNNNLHAVAGSAVVFSPALNPYEFCYYKYNQAENGFLLQLTGGKDAAVKITTSASGGYVTLAANQSSTYSGAWVFGAGTVACLYRYTQWGNNYTSAEFFGKAPDEFNPKGVTMGKGGTFRVQTYANFTMSAADNRGLFLDAAGGNVYFGQTQNYRTDFAWPISGSGTFCVNGNGTFYFSATSTVPVSVTSSSVGLYLCDKAALKGGLSVTDGKVINLNAATDYVTIASPTLTNAKFTLPISADGAQCAKIRFEGDLSGLTGVTGIALSQMPSVSVETDIPVFVIDSAVTREFSSADFNPYAVAGAQCPTVSGVKVERDAVSGDQTVSVTLVPYVRSLGGQAGNNVNFANSADWTDKVLPAVGTTKNYLIYDVNVWWSPDGDRAVTAPGQRVTLYNPGGGRYGVLMRTKSFSFGRLLALDKASVTWWGYNGQSGLDQTLGGNLEVRTTANEYVTLNAGSQNAIVSATVAGTGNIFVCTTNTASGTCSLSLTGTNTGYTGYLCASNTAAAANNKLSLKISDESNLGGNPLVFSAGALTVGNACSLTPTALVVIDDTNRGVTFNAGAAVDAAASCSLAVKSPIVFGAGTVSKSGAGTFAWGAGGSTIAPGATLQVAEGCVKPQGFDALDGLVVSFADGAGFAFDFPLAAGDSRSTYGVDMRSATVSKAGERIKVRFELDDSVNAQFTATVPLATFADVASAQAFVDSADIEVRGVSVVLSVSEKTLGSGAVATVTARISKMGFVIICR